MKAFSFYRTSIVLVWLMFPGHVATATEMPRLFHDDFTSGANQWQPTDPLAWKVITDHGNQIYSLYRQSDYKPPHRSPHNISLLKGFEVSDFELHVRVKTTARDYGHRSMCLFFGYQDPAHFYYVHLGQERDDHANQIFIVNDAPRVKISKTTTDGTPWDEHWHNVRIVRKVKSGVIEVFWDNFEKPVMTAEDKTFLWGRVGLGSFDDTGDWDDFELYGIEVEKP